MKAEYLTKKFEAALSYSDYLATDPEKAANWNKIYEQTQLTDEQQTLIKRTKAECKKVRDEAAEGMARVTEKLDVAQKLGNAQILEIDTEVGSKRKQLEAVRVELQNLQAKLAAA